MSKTLQIIREWAGSENPKEGWEDVVIAAYRKSDPIEISYLHTQIENIFGGPHPMLMDGFSENPIYPKEHVYFALLVYAHINKSLPYEAKKDTLIQCSKGEYLGIQRIIYSTGKCLLFKCFQEEGKYTLCVWVQGKFEENKYTFVCREDLLSMTVKDGSGEFYPIYGDRMASFDYHCQHRLSSAMVKAAKPFIPLSREVLKSGFKARNASEL